MPPTLPELILGTVEVFDPPREIIGIYLEVTILCFFLVTKVVWQA